MARLDLFSIDTATHPATWPHMSGALESILDSTEHPLVYPSSHTSQPTTYNTLRNIGSDQPP